MTTLDTLVARNQEFAAHQFSKDLPLMPTLRAMIIGCVDPRVDPAHVFGLGPGEAIVIHNVGGRITPAMLETMEMLGRIAQADGGPPAHGMRNEVVKSSTLSEEVSSAQSRPLLVGKSRETQREAAK